MQSSVWKYIALCYTLPLVVSAQTDSVAQRVADLPGCFTTYLSCSGDASEHKALHACVAFNYRLCIRMEALRQEVMHTMLLVYAA